MATFSPSLAPVARPLPRVGVRWAIVALLVGLTAVAYEPVRHFGFVNYDDQVNVINEPHVHQGVTGHNVWWAATTSELGPWMPLSIISFLIDGQLFHADPRVMHVENVVLHATAGVLLFLWLAEATGAVGRSGAVAALFLLHPMHVESVAWITERRDVLSTALLMAAVWAYVRYAATGRGVTYAAAVGLYALSLTAKSMGMSVPVLLLLLDAWPLRRLPSSAGDRAGWRRVLWEKVPFLMLAVPDAAMAAYGQHVVGASYSLQALPIGPRVANSLVTTVLYVTKLAVPRGLAATYLAPAGGWSAAQAVAAAGVIAVAAAVAYRCRRRMPYLPVGLAWFAIAVLPVSGLAQVGIHSMADRYSYLPSIGLGWAAVWSAADGARAALRSDRLRWGTSAAVAAALLVGLTIACRHQVSYWRDTRTLFGHTMDVTADNWFAEYNLGLEDAAAGDYRSAEARFRHSLTINPNFTETYDDLGNCVYLSDPRRAIPIYREAIRRTPNKARAYMNLGNALLATGERADAAAAYARAVQLDPASDFARHQLAVAQSSPH